MKFHFIGIAGTGMGAVAGLLKSAGHEVRGSDEAVYPPMSDALKRMGIPVMCPFDEKNLDWGPDEVVVGNVCRRDHKEVFAAEKAKIPLTSFPAILEKRILPGRKSIVVSGTHGKTTTSTLLAYLLWKTGQNPGWFIGGIPRDLPTACTTGQGEPFVLEGDEYDTAFFDKGSKFLHYCPFAVLLTGVEFDHADIFPNIDAVTASFSQLLHLVPAHGILLASADNDIAQKLIRTRAGLTYGLLDEDADYRVTIHERTSDGWYFSMHGRKADPTVLYFCPLMGLHNLRNTAGALAMCMELGVSPHNLAKPLAVFKGVRRRQEELAQGRGIIAVDDFGHHPTAIRVTIDALLQRYPDRRLVVVFEPRSATSRRAVFQHEYAQVLAAAPRVLLAPAYDQSRIPEDQRLNLEILQKDITMAKAHATLHEDFDNLYDTLCTDTQPGDLVVFFSSGAIGGIKQRFAEFLSPPSP